MLSNEERQCLYDAAQNVLLAGGTEDAASFGRELANLVMDTINKEECEIMEAEGVAS